METGSRQGRQGRLGSRAGVNSFKQCLSLALPFPACKVFSHPVLSLVLARDQGERPGKLLIHWEATAMVAGGGVEILVSRGFRAAVSYPEDSSTSRGSPSGSDRFHGCFFRCAPEVAIAMALVLGCLRLGFPSHRR